MKLTKTTETRSETSAWKYSQLQIDTSDITGLRFAIYDNSPDIKHLYEAKRYRAELQIFTTDRTKCTHKLFNYLGSYKTYLNNKWKQDTDLYKDWYTNEVDRAKQLQNEYNTDAVVLHCNLGLSKAHAGRTDGSYGFYTQPEFAFHMLANEDAMVVEVAINEFRFQQTLDNTTEFDDGKCRLYYEKFDVS